MLYKNMLERQNVCSKIARKFKYLTQKHFYGNHNQASICIQEHKIKCQFPIMNPSVGLVNET